MNKQHSSTAIFPAKSKYQRNAYATFHMRRILIALSLSESIYSIDVFNHGFRRSCCHMAYNYIKALWSSNYY